MVDIMELTDFVPKSFQDELEAECFKLPFFYVDAVSYGNVKKVSSENHYHFTDNPGFTHTFISNQEVNSHQWMLVKPILTLFSMKTGINIKKILFCRARLTIQAPGHCLDSFNGPHVDLYENQEYHTLVYYVNNSDGDTVLFDKLYDPSKSNDSYSVDKSVKIIKRSAPIKGNGLFFNGFCFHSGNSPVNHKKRLILNFDFTIE